MSRGNAQRWLLAATLSSGLGGVCLEVRAQTSSCAAGDRDCGKRAFAEGTESFDKADYARALERFQAAAAAGAHPIVRFNLALCLARLGRFTLARDEFSAILQDPGVAADLRARIEHEREAAGASLAHVSVEAAAPENYLIDLDGKALGSAVNEVDVDPGTHHLVVSNAGTTVLEQDVTLEPGEHLRLRVTSRSRALEVVVVPEAKREPAAAPKPQRPEEAPARLSPVVFYAAAGATALLAGVTVWSGLDVRHAYDDYRRDLPRLTLAQANARVADGHALERRTNVLIAATALAATGTAVLGLVFVDFRRANAQASLVLAPLGAALHAEF